jgi:hypothetical protein
MTTTTEIAPDVYRISTHVPEANLQFNQFLVKDDEPFSTLQAGEVYSRSFVRRSLVYSSRKVSAGSGSVILRLMSAARLTNG